MDTLQNKGDPLINCYAFPRIKEEEDMESSYTDNSGQEFSTQSDDHIKTEDSSNSYGSVKEEADSNTQGDLVYNPHTLLWIKRVDEAELTTDDDSEAKEPQVDAPSLKERHLKPGATGGTEKEVKRRPRFTAAEEFVLVTELLEHYDKLFGERARITPFAQKVSIWQKVLDNVNSVGVVQRGIEEAKKHWHLYKHRLMEKLVAIRKQTSGSGPGHPLLVQLTPLESKLADLFKLEFMLRSPPHPSVVQHSLRSQDSVDAAGEKRKVNMHVQNGSSEEQGVGGLRHGDYSHSKAPRNIKFSFDENCALVHEAVGVWDSIIGRNAATTSQARKNFLWSRIVEAVNAAGTQPRSAENCKKRLRDIKRRVKAKMADQRKYSQRNGGGPGLELQYLSYEEELMHVIGPDTIRPIDGHVDTDREPRPINHPPPALMGFSSFAAIGHKKEGKFETEEEIYYEDDYWNHLSFDMAEEDEDDDKEMVVKMEPINYSLDAATPSAQPFPVVVQPVPLASQLPPVSTKPIVFTAKPPPAGAKPLPLANKPHSLPTRPPLITNQPASSSVTTPGHQPITTDTGNINKVVGTFHSAQRNYHRSQRHQMHVIHMDLLHLGVGVQQLTRNVKVNNHVGATSRAREFRLKQRDIEEQRQYRAEKLRLLREHHEAKQRIMQEHYEKKEKLMHENNCILQGILQRLSDPAGTLLENTSPPTLQERTPCITATPATCAVPPPPPQNSDRPLTNRGVRTRGGKGVEGT